MDQPHSTNPADQLKPGEAAAPPAGTHAANEAAVGRFLQGELSFLDIPRACRAVLDAHTFDPRPTLDGLLAADRWARQEVRRWTSRNP